MVTRDKLNSIKDKYHLTNEQWADMSGVPVGTVSGIMSGRTARPAFEDIGAMLRSVGESLDIFYDGHEAETNVHAHDPDSGADTVHEYRFSILPLKDDIQKMAQGAIREVYASEVHHNSQTNLRWWRAIAIAEMVIIFTIMIWDYMHPSSGYIQYAMGLIRSAKL